MDDGLASMDRQFSRYLDLLRVIAAFLVLLAHLSDPALTDEAVTVPSQIGYSAVMIFFVLSGYVISYVAAEREFTFFDFAISRIARVYSVVIPALTVTISVDLLFMKIRPFVNADQLMAGIPMYQYVKFPEYLFMDGVFGNNLWGLRQTAFSNGVYWSMCFEVYYYLLFAFAFYLKGWRRIVLLMLTLSAIGPGPMLRFQLWLFGFAVYRLHRRLTMRSAGARLLFAVTAALIALDLATDLNLRIDVGLDLLTNAWVSTSFMRRFAGDTLTGLLVALNIFAARYAAFNFGALGKWFAYLASFTFALYLMHTPLLRLWAAYWHPDPLVLVVMVLASVWLLGQVTERQKDRLRTILRRRLAPIFAAPPARPASGAG
jgi:peptidoglycan/LPS O-acetylase OafA/YrhL